jgi:hypothetical protein
MGRWTPLVLMAGGLAILLGTLLGINFPMGGQQTAKVPPVRRAEGVLPANINVNSTATRNDPTSENRNSAANRNEETSTESQSTAANRNEETATESRSNVAQNNTSTENTTDTTTDNSATETQSTSTPSSERNQDKEPIRALW